MSFQRHLSGLVPPEPTEGWVTLIVSEGPMLTGPWTQVASIKVEKEEVPFEATFQGAEDPAYYQVSWKGKGSEVGEGPVFFLGGPAEEWEPSVEQVAALVWARTKAMGGKQLGTFTDATRPDRATAEQLIQQATQITSGNFTASPCTGNLRESARAHAALYASMLIEASFYPEQTESSGSSFQARLKLWERSVEKLAGLIKANCGAAGEEVEEGAALPAGGFDDGSLIYGRDFPEAW